MSACASAQAPLVKILSDELDRNFTVLKQKGDPAPYFMSYEVTSTDSYALVASRDAPREDFERDERFARPDLDDNAGGDGSKIPLASPSSSA